MLIVTCCDLSVAAIFDAFVNFFTVIAPIPVPDNSYMTDLPANMSLFVNTYRANSILESQRCRPSNPPAGNDKISPMVNLILF
jgi:hypothetical protein